MEKNGNENIIRSTDSSIKIRAIRGACTGKNIPAIIGLLPLIEDGNEGVRESLEEAVSCNPHPCFVKELTGYLESKNPESRNLAVEILYNLVDMDLETIGNLIFENNEDLRIFGCQILGYSRLAGAIPYLRQALGDANANVRNAAAISLSGTCAAFNPDFLIGAIKKEKDDWVKFSILEAINKKGDVSCPGKLKDLLEEGPDFLVIEILKTYRSLGDLSALDDLLVPAARANKHLKIHFEKCILEMLRDGIKDIGMMKKNPGIFSYLKETVTGSTDVWNIYEAIRILGELKDRSLINILKTTIKNRHPLIRIASIEALSGINGSRSRNLIMGCLEDTDKEVRQSAKACLMK